MRPCICLSEQVPACAGSAGDPVIELSPQIAQNAAPPRVIGVMTLQAVCVLESSIGQHVQHAATRGSVVNSWPRRCCIKHMTPWMQDPAAPPEWLAAATNVLAHLAYMEPEAVLEAMQAHWATLCALLNTSNIVARGAAFQDKLRRLNLKPSDSLGGQLSCRCFLHH